MSAFPIVTVMSLTAAIAMGLMEFTAATAIARATIIIIHAITAGVGEATTGPAIGGDAVGLVMIGKAQAGKAIVGRDRAGGGGAGRVRALEVAGGVRALDAAFEARGRVEALAKLNLTLLILR